MKTATKKPFNRRSFVVLMAAFAGVGLPVSGLANHLLQLDPMTVQRHAWMSAHNSLGLTFVVFSSWHAILNRRALLKYTSSLPRGLAKVRREAAYAAALVVGVLGLALGHRFFSG